MEASSSGEPTLSGKRKTREREGESGATAVLPAVQALVYLLFAELNPSYLLYKYHRDIVPLQEDENNPVFW